MDHLLLLLLLLLWSSGAQAEGKDMSTESDEFRLVGGDSSCAGGLELKHEGDWKQISGSAWTLKETAVVCGELDCGSAVSIGIRRESSAISMWRIRSDCLQAGSTLRECVDSTITNESLNLACSDSVRLLNGTGLCSGRLEVRSNQSTQWSSVCDADFDQQDAEVVCRELGCGAPSPLQGALYGEVEAPVWSKEFQCGGHESALLDCRSSDSARTTCSTGKAVGLTCSEPDEIRLVGGDSRCAGRLELKHRGYWGPVRGYYWKLKEAAVVCRKLDCGSAVSIGDIEDEPEWSISSDCVHSGSALRDCVQLHSFPPSLKLTCTDSVRLLDGTGLCSGRLEVRSNQRWSSVCDADFDQQDAEVVCRELGCGAPSALQGALYGEVEAPVWSKEFQCGGHESALLDCRSSVSARTTCSSGKAVGLTCSETNEIRLVGGDSRCAGGLELKHRGYWGPVSGYDLTLKQAAVVCGELDCGSAVSIGKRTESSVISVWRIRSECLQAGSTLRECVESIFSNESLNLACSDSVRLLDGTGLCSGRLEVRSNQRWSSVCEADFDQQDAEVVCRELGCGAPSPLQGALYGEVEAPVWSKEFQCGGHESALLDCRSSDSARTTCSTGKAVGLTCSEPDGFSLLGGESRCAGRLELSIERDWRSLFGEDWTLEEVCRELDCGSIVSIEWRKESTIRPVWLIDSNCVTSGSAVKECVQPVMFNHPIQNLICSDLLLQPIISVSFIDGVSQAHQQGLQVFRGFSFNINCSIQPQYPGGSFQLTFTSFSNAEHSYTQPAVNHSALFLFPVAEPAHQGNYTCVYQVYVFSHNFSSESRRLSVSVSDPPVFPLNVIVLPLSLLLLSAALYFYCKASRGQTSDRQEDTELVNYPLGVGAAEEEGDVQESYI